MLELYHYWDSFCSFKVRLCLHEKALAWQGHHIDLMKFENLTPAYQRINPNRLVPTLIHDGKQLFESSVINEYLDDTFPDVSLKPRDPYERAQMRLWVKHEEDRLFLAVRPASLNLMMKQALGRFSEAELDRHLSNHPQPDKIKFLKGVFKAPFDAQAVQKSRRLLASALDSMNDRLAVSPWLAGATYSLADVAAAPVIDRIQHLGMAELWEALPHVKEWIGRLTSRPAYLAARPRDECRMPKASAALEFE